jgi:formate-dependent nitrite reductase membrane component NrfD
MRILEMARQNPVLQAAEGVVARTRDQGHLGGFWSWVLWLVVIAVAVVVIATLWQAIFSRRDRTTGRHTPSDGPWHPTA